jgi:hypothetical protein
VPNTGALKFAGGGAGLKRRRYGASLRQSLNVGFEAGDPHAELIIEADLSATDKAGAPGGQDV